MADVVITGIGAVTPLGNTVQETWENAIQGNLGIGPITRFDLADHPDLDVRFAAEVKGFDPGQYMTAVEIQRFDRITHLFAAAAIQAINEARILEYKRLNRERVAVVYGTSYGGQAMSESLHARFLERGARKVSVAHAAGNIMNMPASYLTMRPEYGFTGPVMTLTQACASGTAVLMAAMDLIRTGRASVVIAGAAEAPITPLLLASFRKFKALSKDPKGIIRPFDKNRDGFYIGEGAVVFVVEEITHAIGRGVGDRGLILGEVLGAGLTNDAYQITAPREDGWAAGRAMRHAMRDADIQDVDAVYAHATATILGDQAEERAIKLALGGRAYEIPVPSHKSMFGHTFGAAGAISTMLALQSIKTGIVPPTINYHTPDPECDLNCVPNIAQHGMSLDRILVNAFGFGGVNSSVALGRYG
jgi:3-oxoacyl-[acyl-carrier-protein] synthase II